ncbi:GPO family capsid scaffolding protein [Neisseria sp. KEM232]|uniref:GPO family capsid scaffolding protein n=1 Tax=Neisseria sp. KEM232 TaxID=655307 RepID=UPI0012FDEE22|nr:GPO family capsid scaffolding protein [Neisseria sp. KEM232]
MPDKNSKNKVTDWRIIGVSGDTVDGRQISADDLKQMAESYDPAVYGARINLEHCYFTFPGWAGGYGDVLELKAEPWHKDESKTALLARLSVLPNLQELWDGGEKIYTSMEIASDFAKSGRAYLVGLAITDSPASLGTTANFSVAAAQADKGKTFTPYHLTETNERTIMTIAADKSAAAADKPLTAEAAEGIFSRLLAKFTKAEETPVDNKDDATAQAADEKADGKQPGKTEQDEGGKYAAQLTQAAELLEKFAEKLSDQQEKIKELEGKVAAFEKQLETVAFTGNRAPHTGAGEGTATAGW